MGASIFLMAVFFPNIILHSTKIRQVFSTFFFFCVPILHVRCRGLADAPIEAMESKDGKERNIARPFQISMKNRPKQRSRQHAHAEAASTAAMMKGAVTLMTMRSPGLTHAKKTTEVRS
jgi:hypothetical protein